ncbi:metal-dependent phosphohydrolase [Bacillus sp. X1(2014)]|nr:metal-dependent phosphohydrolase [Bacillus sp. X1(2014)]
MIKLLEDFMISYEEKQTIKWFLIFFYIIFIAYDYFFYYLLPVHILHRENEVSYDYWYINYIVLAILIPISYYLYRIGKYSLIKFVFFLGFLTATLITDLITYYGRGESYTSGNMVEVFLFLSLPLFLSLSYYWLVSIGIVFKYVFLGIILDNSYVVMPGILTIILSIMSFFLLSRFQRYVKAISLSYDKQLEGIVKGVIATLELKDPYTRGHSERVANYALLLAKEIGKLTKKEQKSFYYACLLHDIGKVHIPDTILMKPGKLTKEEYEIIKSHPVVGEEAVKDVEGIKNYISVIRSHHERWDGKGYPDQLKGTEIPLLARVIAIADAFDAMTSSRSYRAALPVDEAYKRIIEGKGSQFDPLLVESFKKVYPAWVDYHYKYPWKERIVLKEVEG